MIRGKLIGGDRPCHPSPLTLPTARFGIPFERSALGVLLLEDCQRQPCPSAEDKTFCSNRQRLALSLDLSCY